MDQRSKQALTTAIATLGCAVGLVTASAQAPGSLPQYKPGHTVAGTIRIWGNDAMKDAARRWADGFRRYQPNVVFQTNLRGTGTAMAGLYTGVADLAFMGRPATPKEIMAFEWVFGYKPLALEITTGSLEVPGQSPALAVFVHKDNPLSRLSLEQLDGIFGCEHRRGRANIRTWGELGSQGEWADKPITAYAYDLETGTGSFFREAVLNGSYKWNWEHVKEFPTNEFKDIRSTHGSVQDAARQIVEALATDRYGIGVSNVRYAVPQVKLVAVAHRQGGSYYLPTAPNLVERKYPLTRVIYVYLNREPGKPVDPVVKEFLRYILSAEGQSAVVRDGGFLPLNKQALLDQLKKLE